jgi:hypothetical protein
VQYEKTGHCAGFFMLKIRSIGRMAMQASAVILNTAADVQCFGLFVVKCVVDTQLAIFDRPYDHLAYVTPIMDKEFHLTG